MPDTLKAPRELHTLIDILWNRLLDRGYDRAAAVAILTEAVSNIRAVGLGGRS